MTMKEFLNLYFRQRHFNSMSEAVRKQFVKIAWRGEFRGDMESWWKELVDQAHPFDHKPEPDAITELSDDDWTRLYTILQRAFINMELSRDSLDKKTKAFLDKYLGKLEPGSSIVFESMQLDDTIKNSIKEFHDKILTDDAAYALFVEYAGVEDASKLDYKEFKEAVEKGDYEKDANVRKKLVRMIRSLQRVDLTEYQGFQDIGNKVNDLARRGILNRIQEGLDPEKEPTSADIARLKKNYKGILNSLHDEQKVADDFKRFDGGRISGELEKAIAKTDYTGKVTEKDFVQPEHEDRKTLREKVTDFGKKVYDNSYAHRIVTMHRDRLLSMIAKPIYDAIEAEGIKPTDGLKAIIEKADAIKARMNTKNPKSADNFDWMIKTLKDLSKTSAFAAALRNQREQDKLIENLAKKAAMDGKEAEARVAMEVIHAMSYGLFDSRTMNAVNQMDFTIFSDSGLSWNKNQGINTATKALDGMLKWTVKGVGLAVTAGVNGVRRIRANKTENQKQSKLEQKLYGNNKLSDSERKAKVEELKEKQGSLKDIDQQLKQLETAQQTRDELRTQQGELYRKLTSSGITPEEQAKLQKSIDETQEKLNAAIVKYDRLNDWLNEQGISADERDTLKTEVADLEKQLINPKLSDKQKKKLQEQIDSYDQETAKMTEQNPKAKETYDALMLFWRYLHTHHTKNILGFRTNLVQKRYEENRAMFHKSFEDWRVKQAA